LVGLGVTYHVPRTFQSPFIGNKLITEQIEADWKYDFSSQSRIYRCFCGHAYMCLSVQS
jgi:hypothetical protein